MDEVWAGVRERVLAVREAPHWREVFGADWPGGHGHGFRLEPVLTETEVRAIERRIGEELPGEYRTFLLHVGAGGAGPDYGLFPQRPPGPDAESTPDEEPAPRHRARPFRPEATDELEVHEAEQPRPEHYDDGGDDGGGGGGDEALRRDYAAWEKRHDELYDALTDGTLVLGHQGCGYYSLLAVTGPERGTIWDDVRAVGEGVRPVASPERPRVTFAQWYVGWLERAERTAVRPPPAPLGQGT
ncbi:SMI1/KNR4 family protein [Streptomyces sp. PmtG]